MKQSQNDFRARYEKPALKFFRISLEGGVCQALSNPPIDPYTGLPLGNDF